MADQEDDDEADWTGMFKNRFKSRDGVDQRLQAERKAGRTEKQRARKGPAKTQINFRATAATKAQIDALVAHLEKNATDVIALAIQAFADAMLPKAGGKK